MSWLVRGAKWVVPSRFHSHLRSKFKQQHWCRVVMNREIERFLGGLDQRTLEVLEISGSRDGSERFRSYTTSEYPAYDVCEGPLATEAFDLIIAEQVFEHIKHPRAAARNVYNMLRRGGYFVISTPFLLKIHGSPMDYYRWSTDGLTVLLEEAGFSVIKADSWGNRQCLKSDLKAGFEWTYYLPIIHSLKNDRQLPIVVWAFARKT